MQKLIISRQFMGVEPCTIELNRFLLLIGEQASGKSTIAKLIFFFQTLPDAIYENSIAAYFKKEDFDFKEHINLIARKKFLETFGPTSRNEGFEIQFNYGLKDNILTYLRIYQGKDHLTYALFESSFGYNIGSTIKAYLNSSRFDDSNVDQIRFRQQLHQDLDVLFYRQTNAHTYLIAGRNTIVAYPETFEKVIEQEYEKLIEDEVKEQDFEQRQRLGNERLLYQFVQWSKGVRNNFKNNGQTFKKVALSLNNKDATKRIQDITEKILKGVYESSEWGEQIKLKDSTLRVPLKDASSGQQEVLRILQGLFLSIGLKNRKEFFVVEEPEGHLYPLAQKELMNAFAVFLNTIQQGRIIVTTHSPYILACINILLFATYVAKETGKANLNGASPSKSFWLDSNDFNAYSLGQKENYLIDIKDSVTGLIDQNYLDTISEQLGLQYQELYNLLIKELQ